MGIRRGKMNYTKGEIKTLGDAWEVLKKHGLEGSYCPICDQFAQARVLQKQDELISDMYEALKNLLEGLDNPMRIPAFELVDKASLALAKAEGVK